MNHHEPATETREDAIIDLCILAGKTTAETSTWLASGKSYAEVFKILSMEAERADAEPRWWPESEAERQSKLHWQRQNPN
jgi:hypothetical protein